MDKQILTQQLEELKKSQKIIKNPISERIEKVTQLPQEISSNDDLIHCFNALWSALDLFKDNDQLNKDGYFKLCLAVHAALIGNFNIAEEKISLNACWHHDIEYYGSFNKTTFNEFLYEFLGEK
jgi:hypothetical protein